MAAVDYNNKRALEILSHLYAKRHELSYEKLSVHLGLTVQELYGGMEDLQTAGYAVELEEGVFVITAKGMDYAGTLWP